MIRPRDILITLSFFALTSCVAAGSSTGEFGRADIRGEFVFDALPDFAVGNFAHGSQEVFFFVDERKRVDISIDSPIFAAGQRPPAFAVGYSLFLLDRDGAVPELAFEIVRAGDSRAASRVHDLRPGVYLIRVENDLNMAWATAQQVGWVVTVATPISVGEDATLVARIACGDEYDHVPLRATVSVDGQSVDTSTDGAATITGIASGERSLVVALYDDYDEDRVPYSWRFTGSGSLETLDDPDYSARMLVDVAVDSDLVFAPINPCQY